MVDQLHLAFLGHPEISRAGVAVTGYTSNKVPALLCYLAVTRQPHLRPALAGLLWGELPEASAQGNLRKALSNLRRLLAPHVDISRDSVAFNRTSAYRLDVEAFEDGVLGAAGESGVEQLESAVALYRDDFLAGFYVREAPAFEEWVLAQRARLRTLALQALHTLGVHYSRLGQAGRSAAIDYTTRLLALEPWREEAHRQLMLLLAASGQRSAALAQYETCRRLLAEELGVEPSVEVRETYQMLLRGEQPPDLALILAGQERPPRQVGACPYRGLAAFREQDAPFFFGRDGFTGRLDATVRRLSVAARPALVCLVGSSGSGKSSAVSAGLLPRLHSTGKWLIAALRPGAQPFHSLTAALAGALSFEMSPADSLLETHKLADALAGGDLSLADVAALALASGRESGSRSMLLVIDQFEELYTLCPEPDLRRRFVDLLLKSLGTRTGRRPARLVLLPVMRADFMGQALAYRPFADALQEAVLLLGPMNRAEMHAAIEQPAETQGAAFEAGLVDRILDDVGEAPGNLPLLEFALTLLWERNTQGWLTHAGYEEIGRVEGALARHADEVYAGLEPADRAAARQILVQLVRPGEGTEDTRRLALRSELPQEHWRLMQHLADKRLVVTGRDASGVETVEVVHEALIRSWGRLQGWMEADRTFRAWQERMRAALHQWQADAQDEGALLRGVPLAEAEHWLAERPGELSEPEREFVEAGLALRERAAVEREAQRQRDREAAHRLAAQVQLATSRELAAAAVANLHIDPERSVLLAMEALSRSDTLEARNALHQALPELRLLRSVVAHQSTVYSVSFAPDGTCMATSSHDTTARIWDAATYELLFTLETDGNVFDVRFSPNGKLLATSGITDVTVWDPATGQRVFTLPGESIGTAEGYELGVGRIAFSPDGARLAVANQDGAPRVWDLATQSPLFSLSGQTRICKAVAYSPDGTLLATGADDGRVRVWDARTGQGLRSLEGHRSYVWVVAFSPEGARLVSVDDAGTLRIRDVSSGESLLSLTSPSAGGFRSTLFLPDGSGVVTTGYDGTTRIWDAATGRQRLLLAGHISTVLDAAVSPDGRTLATCGGDGTLKTWDLGPGREVLTLAGNPSSTNGEVAYSPDGRRLAASSADDTIRIWDPAAGELVGALRTVEPHLWGPVAYSRDGTSLAAGALDGFWAVWDTGTGQVLACRCGHASIVEKVDISPDGRRLLTASWDGTAKVWDIVSSSELIANTSHMQPATSSNWVFGVAFGPDGRHAASAGSDAKVRVWDVETGQERLALPGGEHAVLMTSLAYSQDGALIAGGQFNGEIRVWEARTGKLLRVLSGHSSGVSGLHFSTDGTRLASAALDTLAKVWDLGTGLELATLYGNAGRLSDIDFSPDSTRVATSGEDGTVRIYTVTTEDLVALARTRVGRSLTRDECRRYLHTDERP